MSVSTTVSATRIDAANDRPVRCEGRYVLYWMTAARRTTWNFGLQYAVDWARQLNRPLLVLEALRCDYPWASDRLHAFVVQGMIDNARRLSRSTARYYPYVEPRPGAGRGLLAALAAEACVVVTDRFPCFFLPRMVAAAAKQVSVRLETVDSNGLIPLLATGKQYLRAYDFRRFVRRTIARRLSEAPRPNSLARAGLPPLARLPGDVQRRWRPTRLPEVDGVATMLRRLPIDHAVGVADERGGHRAAVSRLSRFLAQRLANYAVDRNHPDRRATSGLSPYLHFGHISTYEIVDRLARSEGCSLGLLAAREDPPPEGLFGLSASAEAFVDQLVVWRELGLNMCQHRDDFDRFASLPRWARDSLARHAGDRREHIYSLEQFERAETHDALWNAAQRELVRTGAMHNYLRMLWGKKIIEWSALPRDALATMIHLNDKYALDGRDPNSYSGIFWVLGRYDRPWGPRRPVFGTVRYMSLRNTRRKVELDEYLTRFGD